jgi:hypothetical protein
MRRVAIALLFCALAGCIPLQQRTAVYNPAELVPYSRTGTGKITGQAFLKTVGGDVKYGAGNTVAIHPVTSLTTEWYDKGVVQGIPLGPGNAHADDYRKTTVAEDGEGRFEFDGLPPGDYYVTCEITWGVPSDLGMMPTGGIAYAKVTVHNGETVKAVVTR